MRNIIVRCLPQENKMASNGVISAIVLHYSATYPDQDITAADIDKMHRARGWAGIGYHYFIRRSGMVERGRAETELGAHVAGQNTGKIGICCAGGIERATGPNVGVDNRTTAQKAATVALIRELLTRYPSAKVVGHRDLGATQCPGFDAARWWAEVSRPAAAPAAKTAWPEATPLNPQSPWAALWRSIIALLGR